MVIRDPSADIKAFMNEIPSFDDLEANYDLLQHGEDSLGNINDFLLINFIAAMEDQGFKRVNLGLSPYPGLTIQRINPSSIVLFILLIQTAIDYIHSAGYTALRLNMNHCGVTDI